MSTKPIMNSEASIDESIVEVVESRENCVLIRSRYLGKTFYLSVTGNTKTLDFSRLDVEHSHQTPDSLNNAVFEVFASVRPKAIGEADIHEENAQKQPVILHFPKSSCFVQVDNRGELITTKEVKEATEFIFLPQHPKYYNFDTFLRFTKNKHNILIKNLVISLITCHKDSIAYILPHTATMDKQEKCT